VALHNMARTNLVSSPVWWGAVDSYIAIYQCSKNGGKAGSERHLFVFHRRNS